MNFRKPKRTLGENEELDITSLMDILFILLFFLIQNFNSSELSVNVAEELALPYSTSQSIPQKAPVLQLNSQLNIYFNGSLVANLKDELISDKINMALSSFKPQDEKGRILNLLFDKKVNYESINKILRIVDSIGFGKYKLIVQGDS